MRRVIPLFTHTVIKMAEESERRFAKSEREKGRKEGRKGRRVLTVTNILKAGAARRVHAALKDWQVFAQHFNTAVYCTPM